MRQILTTTLLLLMASWASAAVIYLADYTRQGGIPVPDGSPVGITIQAPVDKVPTGSAVVGVKVTLNISGGYNADLVARLTAPNGQVRTLMAEPGVTPDNKVGQSGKGMNITLSDDALENIQDQMGAGVLSGSYRAADGLGTFCLAGSAAANGTWTLYLADLSSGGGTSHLTSWILELKLKPSESSTKMAGNRPRR